MSFDSCQLYRRQWIIKFYDNVLGDFNGEAVIGQFPLLWSGEKEFVYECCITSTASPASIEDWRIHKEAPFRLKLLDFLWFCQSTSSDATILLSMVTILA
ncbi:putative ApaG domain-containing protein [Helianthus debilis subsp. tardiflorus]